MNDTFFTTGGLNAQGNSVRINATSDVVVSCWRDVNDDFSHVYPITPGRLYGWNQKTTRGTQVDCLDLTDQLTDLPSKFVLYAPFHMHTKSVVAATVMLSM